VAVSGELSEAECRVCAAFPVGELVDFGTGNTADDDPAGGDDWGPGRQVRAEVVAALLRGAVSPEPGHVGKVWLRRAFIIGLIDLQDADISYALRLEECHIAEGVNLNDATGRAIILTDCRLGSVSLQGANITGRLSFSGSHLTGADDLALAADRLVVTGGMACDKGFRADGQIRLPGAHIGGRLTFRSAWLDSHSGPTLIANGLVITGDMVCDEGFRCGGEVFLPGAQISGRLSFSRAVLDGRGGRALKADALAVGGAMFCDQHFRADGEILLQNASIRDDLSFKNAQLAAENRPVLTAIGLSVGGTIYLDEGFQANGEIVLRNARIGVLADDRDSWPPRMELAGLTYGDMRPYLPARERLDWLKRSADYPGQPSAELAAYYQRAGHDAEARRVLLAGRRARSRRCSGWRRWWGTIQDLFVGYGYAPGRAFAVLTAALALGSAYFSAHRPPPADPAAHVSFNAVVYTLDLLVPAPGLGQASDWSLQGTGLLVAAVLRGLGWLLAITVIAAITRAATGSKG
jgi:hypothetical protein